MPHSGPGPAPRPTRERLLDAALRLFAERGYAAVGVGDVERAAGLAPRRGALYRHFASKEALLEAAVRRYVDSAELARRELGVPDGDVSEQASAVGRLILREMDAQYDITRILERDGDRLPGLVAEFRTRVSERSYAIVADVLRSWLRQATAGAGSPPPDLDALAVLLSGSLINARRSAWTLAAPPGGHDDAALVTSWAALCVAVVGDAAPGYDGWAPSSERDNAE